MSDGGWVFLASSGNVFGGALVCSVHATETGAMDALARAGGDYHPDPARAARHAKDAGLTYPGTLVECLFSGSDYVSITRWEVQP